MEKGLLQWQDKTILVVEDEPMTFRLIEIMLTKTGVKLIKATDGEEAVSLVKKNKSLDLILMDIGLPKMNGYDATIAIKKILPAVPIIAQTAFVMKDHKERCFQSGCTDYISKPYSSDDLIGIIGKHFNK